jgi:hypothetical protein
MLDTAHQFFNRRPPAQIAENVGDVGDLITMKLRQKEVSYLRGHPMAASCSLAALSEKIKGTSSTMRVLP